MIVTDTNIISYLHLTCEFSTQAEQALLKDQFWTAPLLWRSEFRNILSLYVRQKLLILENAQLLMKEALRFMQNHEYEVASDQVLSLAAASGCSAYDCEFVALAKDLALPLITVDKQILKQFPDTAVSLEKFIVN
jgi:predicted nucleic acid-binding protein